MPTAESVKSYWERRPCGTIDDLEIGTPEYFERLERERYESEPMIAGFAEFARWEGKRVLEVGVGQGTDFVQFVRAGAVASGVDLTEAGVALTERRLGLEGLSADLRVADAENLPFADDTFDLVYSWGVLHHASSPQRALDEVRRVLKPDGEVRIMLYSSRSWVALGQWLRHGLVQRKSVREVLAERMESPGTQAYTGQELIDMFSGWQLVQFKRWVTAYDRSVGGPLADRFAPRFGWFVGIRARAGIAAAGQT